MKDPIRSTLVREVDGKVEPILPKTMADMVYFDETHTVLDKIIELENSKENISSGKGLSTNDFTDEYKDKLDSINQEYYNIDDWFDITSDNLLKNKAITERFDMVEDLLGDPLVLNDSLYAGSNIINSLISLKNELDQFSAEITSNVYTKDEIANKLKELKNTILGITDGEVLDQALDTIKEIQDWINSDTTGGAKLISDVASLKTTVGDNNSGLVKRVNDLELGLGTINNIANKSGTTAWSRIKAIENFVGISNDDNISTVVAKHETQLGGLYFTQSNGKWGYKTSSTGSVTPFRNPLSGVDSNSIAVASNVLTGKHFATDASDDVIGTMPNYGTVIVNPGESDRGAGYYNLVKAGSLSFSGSNRIDATYVNKDSDPNKYVSTTTFYSATENPLYLETGTYLIIASSLTNNNTNVGFNGKYGTIDAITPKYYYKEYGHRIDNEGQGGNESTDIVVDDEWVVDRIVQGTAVLENLVIYNCDGARSNYRCGAATFRVKEAGGITISANFANIVYNLYKIM